VQLETPMVVVEARVQGAAIVSPESEATETVPVGKDLVPLASVSVTVTVAFVLLP
jgi:hypothetical protein